MFFQLFDLEAGESMTIDSDSCIDKLGHSQNPSETGELKYRYMEMEGLMSPEVDSTISTLEQTLSPEVETKMSIEVDNAKLGLPEEGLLSNECSRCTDERSLVNNLSRSIESSEVIGFWSEQECQKKKSSTWRETEAVHRMIRTHSEVLKDSVVKVYSDCKNVKSVLSHGSNKPDLKQNC